MLPCHTRQGACVCVVAECCRSLRLCLTLSDATYVEVFVLGQEMQGVHQDSVALAVELKVPSGWEYGSV